MNLEHELQPFHYVASGLTYMRIGYSDLKKDQQSIDYYNNCFKKINGNNSHSLGLLHNAFSEKGLGPIVNDLFDTDNYSNMTDSGGLQIITTGSVITQEMKLKIYEYQLANSEYAMSFDEIPLTVTGEKSSRNDYTNRFFDIEKFEECAKISGKNYLEQINIFLESGSSCKPIMIIHGNCYDTFLKWHDIMLNEIPDSKRKYIDIIALSGASLGTGTLEDIERAYALSEIASQYKQVHFLGLGSIRRLLPYIIFKRNGLLDNIKISYDSTTHTSAPHMGRYFLNGKDYKFTREFDKRYEVIYNDINSKFDLDMSLEKFHETLNKPGSESIEGGYVFRAYCGFISSCILNFTKIVDDMYQHPELIKHLPRELKTLTKLKTKDDIEHWFDEISRFVHSRRISTEKRLDLDGFSDLVITKEMREYKPPKPQKISKEEKTNLKEFF